MAVSCKPAELLLARVLEEQRRFAVVAHCWGIADMTVEEVRRFAGEIGTAWLGEERGAQLAAPVRLANSTFPSAP